MERMTEIRMNQKKKTKKKKHQWRRWQHWVLEVNIGYDDENMNLHSTNPITIIHFNRIQTNKQAKKYNYMYTYIQNEWMNRANERRERKSRNSCHKNKIEVNNWCRCAQRTEQKRHLKPILMIISAFLANKNASHMLAMEKILNEDAKDEHTANRSHRNFGNWWTAFTLLFLAFELLLSSSGSFLERFFFSLARFGYFRKMSEGKKESKRKKIAKTKKVG